MRIKDRLKESWYNTKDKLRYAKDLVRPKNLAVLTALTWASLFSNETTAQSGQAHINGRVTSGQTSQGISNAEVLYNQITPETDTIITTTNNNGEYNFNITDVEKEENTETIGEIKYYWNNIITPSDGTVTVTNIQGRKLFDQEIKKGPNTINLDQYADGVYFTNTNIDGIITTNKIIKIDGKYPLIGATNKPIIKETKKNNLDKILQEYTFTLEFRDLTETHHPYIILDYEPLTLPATYTFNTPLLPKGDLPIPFTNPRNGEQITTNRQALFFYLGVDYLLYAAYKGTVKKLLTHLDIQDLPPQYTEQQIRDATLEILTETGLPLDSIWQETTDYINPILVPESTIGYIFSDSASMGGTDLIIHDIISNQTGKKSYQFQFNTDTIEPQHIKKFIKYAWYVGLTFGAMPVPGYWSSNPRDTTINELTESERSLFRTLFSAPSMAETGIPWWVSAENIPENNYDRPEHKATKEQLEQFLSEQQKPYALYFKKVGETYEMTKKILEEKDLRFK